MIQNVVFIKTDTGGFEPQHSLLRLALIVTDTRFTELRRFETFVRHPEFNVTADALANNRIDLTQSPAWPDVLTVKRSVLTFLGKPLSILDGVPDPRQRWMLYGKNTSFDVRVLHAFFGASAFDSMFMFFSRDVTEAFLHFVELGVYKMPNNLSLPDICTVLGIAHDPDAHGTIYDAEMAVQCMQAMYNTRLRVRRKLFGAGPRTPAGAVGDDR